MPKIKNRQKYYVILDKNGYLYGAFPLTEEGEESAKQHLKKIASKEAGIIKSEFRIEEK
tara:strand:- start:538 stop:714 length:177 start_codon:yes stop_codon:yes gene_type:complete